ncbi:MAG: Fic family protein [Bifidobacteriaceae bacterium]|jgi:Fic family protein|nr:Fic family protein [Bifidobacteriaceae bacterium]
MTFVLQLADDAEQPMYSSHLIRALHFMLAGFDLRARPGRWRDGPVYVTGQHGVVAYTAPDAALVPELITALVVELNRAQGPALVTAAMAHLNLVRIHPFRDGNGRAARVLQSLVLGRQGMLTPLFMSVEEYLGTHTPAYYEALATTGDRFLPDRDAGPWLRFMLQAHVAQAEAYRERLRRFDRLWLDLMRLTGLAEDDRTLGALMDAAMGLKVTRASYQALLERDGRAVSSRSAARDLMLLVERGWLAPVGDNRGRVYVAASPLAALWPGSGGGR